MSIFPTTLTFSYPYFSKRNPRDSLRKKQLKDLEYEFEFINLAEDTISPGGGGWKHGSPSGQ